MRYRLLHAYTIAHTMRIFSFMNREFWFPYESKTYNPAVSHYDRRLGIFSAHRRNVGRHTSVALWGLLPHDPNGDVANAEKEGLRMLAAMNDLSDGSSNPNGSSDEQMSDITCKCHSSCRSSGGVEFRRRCVLAHHSHQQRMFNVRVENAIAPGRKLNLEHT